MKICASSAENVASAARRRCFSSFSFSSACLRASISSIGTAPSLMKTEPPPSSAKCV